MNESKLLMPNGLGALHVGEMLALAGVSQARLDKRVSNLAAQLISNMATVADELVVSAIEKRTATEFSAACNEVMPKYFAALRAISDIATIVAPHETLELLTNESFSEAEAEFRDHGLAAFGAALRDQAIFTVWTLRKISDLCQRIDSVKLATDLKEPDSEIFRFFIFHTISARFHLHCMRKSMQLGRPMYPEVLDLVINGLRNAVNAYAWARRALDLRLPIPEPELASVTWDDEDQSLLNEADMDVLDPAEA
jgi:hypothetical protein